MRITVYPLRSAMHGAINISTRRFGYICFKPPTYVFGRWWPAYLYLSPNATPWAATLLIGRGYSRAEKMMARVRRALWGHGYDCNQHDPQRGLDYFEPIGGELSDGSLSMLREATKTKEPPHA